jgi:hypothetical protein
VCYIKDDLDNNILLNDPYDGAVTETAGYLCYVVPPISPPGCDVEADLTAVRPDGALGSFVVATEDLPKDITLWGRYTNSAPCAPGGSATYELVKVAALLEQPEHLQILGFPGLCEDLQCVDGTSGTQFNGVLDQLYYDSTNLLYNAAQLHPFIGPQEVMMYIYADVGEDWHVLIWNKVTSEIIYAGVKHCGNTPDGVYMTAEGWGCSEDQPDCVTVIALD